MPKVEIILQFAIESGISMDDLPIKDIYINMEIMWCSTAMWDYYQTVHSPRYIPFQCHGVLVLFASRTSSPVSLLIMERRRRERFTKGRTWIRKDRGAVSKQWSIYIYHLTLFREIFSNETWGQLGLNHQIWGSISNIGNMLDVPWKIFTLEAHNAQWNVYETLIQIEFYDCPHQFIWFIIFYNI